MKTDMSAAIRLAKLIRYAKSKKAKANAVHQWNLAIQTALKK